MSKMGMDTGKAGSIVAMKTLVYQALMVVYAMVMVIFLLLPCVILSGLFTSIRAMPEWLQTLTLINPLRHAIVALRAIYFENAGFADLVPSLIPIVLAGVLSLAWASWLFRHKIQ